MSKLKSRTELLRRLPQVSFMPQTVWLPGPHCQNTSDLDLNTQITLNTSSQQPVGCWIPWKSDDPWLTHRNGSSFQCDAKVLCTRKHSLCYTGGKLDKLFQSRYPAYQGLRALQPSPAPLVGICCIHSHPLPALAAGGSQQTTAGKLCRAVQMCYRKGEHVSKNKGQQSSDTLPLSAWSMKAECLGCFCSDCTGPGLHPEEDKTTLRPLAAQDSGEVTGICPIRSGLS